MAFPKWVGWLATLVALATTVYTTMHPGVALPAWIVAAMAIINQFTHSTALPGTSK